MSKFILIEDNSDKLSLLLRKKLRKTQYCFIKNGILKPYKNKDKNKILTCEVFSNIYKENWVDVNYQKFLTYISYLFICEWYRRSNYNEYIKNNIIWFNKTYTENICFNSAIERLISSKYSYVRNDIVYSIHFKLILNLNNATYEFYAY